MNSKTELGRVYSSFGVAPRFNIDSEGFEVAQTWTHAITDKSPLKSLFALSDSLLQFRSNQNISPTSLEEAKRLHLIDNDKLTPLGADLIDVNVFGGSFALLLRIAYSQEYSDFRNSLNGQLLVEQAKALCFSTYFDVECNPHQIPHNVLFSGFMRTLKCHFHCDDKPAVIKRKEPLLDLNSLLWSLSMTYKTLERSLVIPQVIRAVSAVSPASHAHDIEHV